MIRRVWRREDSTSTSTPQAPVNKHPVSPQQTQVPPRSALPHHQPRPQIPNSFPNRNVYKNNTSQCNGGSGPVPPPKSMLQMPKQPPQYPAQKPSQYPSKFPQQCPQQAYQQRSQQPFQQRPQHPHQQRPAQGVQRTLSAQQIASLKAKAAAKDEEIQRIKAMRAESARPTEEHQAAACARQEALKRAFGSIATDPAAALEAEGDEDEDYDAIFGSGDGREAKRQRAAVSGDAAGGARAAAIEEDVRRVLDAKSDYDVLQVSPESFTVAAVKRQYRSLAVLLHPDKCALPGAREAFQRVSEAQQSLMRIATGGK